MTVVEERTGETGGKGSTARVPSRIAPVRPSPWTHPSRLSPWMERVLYVEAGRFIWHDVGVDETYGSSTASVRNV